MPEISGRQGLQMFVLTACAIAVDENGKVSIVGACES